MTSRRVEQLIKQSSLGSREAVELRRTTPRATRDRVVMASNTLRDPRLRAT